MVLGGRVRSAACSADDPQDELRPCGNADGTGWRVRLEPAARYDRVMAQLDQI